MNMQRVEKLLKKYNLTPKSVREFNKEVLSVAQNVSDAYECGGDLNFEDELIFVTDIPEDHIYMCDLEVMNRWGELKTGIYLHRYELIYVIGKHKYLAESAEQSVKYKPKNKDLDLPF